MPGVIVRRAARADVREAALWYEGQRPGLGIEFTLEFDVITERIAQNPLQFPEIAVEHAARYFADFHMPSTLLSEDNQP